MQTDGFRAWLEQREPRLAQASVKTLIADAKRVEKHYGDLDGLYQHDRLAGVVQELQYSAADARRGAPNPSRVPVPNPKSLASYKQAVRTYSEYRKAASTPSPPEVDDGASGGNHQAPPRLTDRWTGTCAYGPLFDRMRLAVFEVYWHRCVACGQKFPGNRLHAHHVAPYRYPCGTAECGCGAPKIAFGDLIPLCEGCHSVVERQKEKNRRSALPRGAGRSVVLGDYEFKEVLDPTGDFLCWGWTRKSGWSGWLYDGDGDSDQFEASAWRSDHRESDEDGDWCGNHVDPFEAIDRAVEAGMSELRRRISERT